VRVFIDSNIPMYVAGKEHPHREPARRFLERIQNGEVEGCTSTEVLQEILYRYVGLRRTDLAVEVYDLFVSLCSFVLPVTLADTDRARDLVREGAKASVRDAVHAAVMLNNDIDAIASFDRGFEHIPGIERVELA
jgi:predicted nucleic acid-binding protein